VRLNLQIYCKLILGQDSNGLQVKFGGDFRPVSVSPVNKV
jgi:hypothetical protein